MQLPPEKLLLRWFNHHLREAGVSRECTNFGPDVRDCELYAYLLQQIDPEHKISSRTILAVAEPAARAAHVAAVGPRLGAEFTVQPADIISGNEKLNMAFVAALFNACPALDPPEEEQVCPCHLLPPPTSHLPPPTSHLPPCCTCCPISNFRCARHALARQILALMEELPDDDAGDSREARAFRMWINSLGMAECPHVEDLFTEVIARPVLP